MKELGSLKNPKQEVAKLVERVKAAEYFVNSATVGTVNFIAIKTAESPPYVDAWIVKNEEDAKSHPHLQAFGSKNCGEMVVSNMTNQNRILLFGTGKKFNGSALFVQKLDGIYTVVYNRDEDSEKNHFRLTSTRDENIVQILLYLLQDGFQDADITTVGNSLNLLIASEVDGDE